MESKTARWFEPKEEYNFPEPGDWVVWRSSLLLRQSTARKVFLGVLTGKVKVVRMVAKINPEDGSLELYPDNEIMQARYIHTRLKSVETSKVPQLAQNAYNAFLAWADDKDAEVKRGI